MKTRWYRKSGIKGLLVLLTVFFMVAACAGAGVSVMIMNTGVQPLDSKDYVDSQSFTDNVYNFLIRSLMRLMSGIFWIRRMMRN